MDLTERAERHLGHVRDGMRELDAAALTRIAELLRSARDGGRRVFVLGNGGSATTASHLACDLARPSREPGAQGCRAISLTDSAAVVTARANDSSFERVFVAQLETHLEPGDLVVALSASGKSPNVLEAVRFAHRCGATTVALVGSGGGALAERVDCALTCSSADPSVVESLHVSLGHVLADWLRTAEPTEETARTRR